MSKIEWTNETWNPIVGCSKTSPGCDNCYAEKAAISPRLQQFEQYRKVTKGITFTATDTTKMTAWNRKTAFVESALSKPLGWKKGRMVFVCSMGDLFHESVPFEWIDKVFAVMALCPQHTFQVLTKRPERMLEYLGSHILFDAAENNARWQRIKNTMRLFTSEQEFRKAETVFLSQSFLPNVWLGGTAEDQQRADERIPVLMKCPAAKRFVSCEPLLGEVDLGKFILRDNYFMTECPCGWFGSSEYCNTDYMYQDTCDCPKCGNYTMEEYDDLSLDWVICGGESGPGARPMHPEWARSLRDQCKEAGVPFFFKQWGEWADFQVATSSDEIPATTIANGKMHTFDDKTEMIKVGKKKTGRLLDGVEHSEYPVNPVNPV